MTQNTEFWLSLVVQFAIAVGTISAVVVALFGGWLRGRLAPPLLKLELKDDSSRLVPTTLTSPDGSTRQTVSRYYHLGVANKRRWSPATQVQVFLLAVEEPDAGGEYKINWVGEVPIVWRFQAIEPLRRTIGAPMDCDLCSIVKEKWVELHPLITPNALNARRSEPFDIIVTVQARSVESDSDPMRIKIAWNGQWADDSIEAAKHLVVKVADQI